MWSGTGKMAPDYLDPLCCGQENLDETFAGTFRRGSILLGSIVFGVFVMVVLGALVCLPETAVAMRR